MHIINNKCIICVYRHLYKEYVMSVPNMKWSWAWHMIIQYMTGETSQAVERRPGKILERHNLEKTAQGRLTWRRRDEAFAQLRNTRAAQ